jgi:LPS export ABC transporter protein LptC
MRDTIDKYLPPLLWIAVLALATWGAWIIVKGRDYLPVNIENPVSTSQNGEIPSAVVDQPILEEVTQDGAVRWTLYLDRIVRVQGAVTELAKPRAVYRFQSGEVLEVTGDAGTYDEDKGLLVLTSNVKGVARQGNLSFNAGSVSWNSEENVMSASGGVEIVREGINFKGDSLSLDLSQELASLDITGGVEVTSSPETLQELEGNPG